MCLVLVWYLGLLAKASTLLLSQYNTRDLTDGILSSFKRYVIHKTSKVVSTRALYSDSAET